MLVFANKVVRERSGQAEMPFSLDFNPYALMQIILNERKFPDIARSALERILRLSILSLEEQGNYSVVSNIPGIVPGFFLGPELRDGASRRKLHFVRNDDAKGYANRFKVSVSVIQNGSYVPPDDLTPADWRLFRFKVMEGQGTLLDEMVRKGILAKGRGYSVVFQPSSDKSRVYLNFDREERLYFSKHLDAEKFAEGVSRNPESKGMIKVIS